MRNLTASELEAKFPKLRSGNYKLTSDATPRYNCFAFAIGDERHWWEAGMFGGRYYWPDKTPDTLDGWISVFVSDGYGPAELSDSRPEPGIEKIAIYVDLQDMLPSHVAYSDGITWKSKLGRSIDIEHDSLNLLEGDLLWEYGIIERILKRSARARPVRQKQSRRSERV